MHDRSAAPVRRCVASVTAVLVVLVGLAVGPMASVGGAAVTASTPGLTRLLSAPVTNGNLLGIATFESGPPSAQKAGALRALGLRVQPLQRLPLALLFGTKVQMRAAVTTGVARDVYPNERMHWNSDVSDRAIRADAAHAAGVDGHGVGVAIVDSGIDATHPALADRVTHNEKIVGPEYLSMLGIPTDPSLAENSIAVPVDQGPYSNSDLSSGHGTHVAGIVAANGTDPGHPALIGVAPRANLIGYSTGDVAFVVTILAAYDDILLHRDAWHIRVVNNSWGGAFRLFDPNDPVNIATKAAHDAGIVVAFAAGNDTEEATINPYSVAPWVISVGAGTVSKQRSDFSSGGLQHDDSLEAAIPADRHLHFAGDRIGLYHPDVSAPGTNIVSTGTPTGAYVGPTAPGGEATASGTSMATPHIAGVAALILQAGDAAHVRLNPEQVRRIMQVTSVPMADGSAFWQSGYGYVDAKAAVDYVRNNFNAHALKHQQSVLDKRVLGARDWKALSSDFWTFTPPPVTVAGTDSHQLSLTVTKSTKAVYATVGYPTTPLVGINGFEYALSLRDAAGSEVATSTASSIAGVSTLFVDLTNATTAPAYGRWTLVASGELGASDPNILLGNAVTVTAAQLAPQRNTGGVAPPPFTATGTRTLFFAAGAASTLPGSSPEGCTNDAGAPDATMTVVKPIGLCHSGNVGYAMNYGAGVPATFTSAPLTTPLTVGGNGHVMLSLVDPAQPAWSEAFASALSYTVLAVDAVGAQTPIAGGDAAEEVQAGATPVQGTYTIEVPPAKVAAGSSIVVQLQLSGVYTSTMRLLYGGGAFATSALQLTTGKIG
jgi:serine protease AprX